MKKSIEIDIEVHREIESQRVDFEETQNDILRRIFGLSNVVGESGPASAPPQLHAKSGLSPIQDYQTPSFKPMPASKAPPASETELSIGQRIKEFHNRFSNQFFFNKPAVARDWQFAGVRLPEGTRLQKWYGGQKYEAEIRDGAIWFEGMSFQSPSAAAMAITGGSNVSGWNFWKYFDPKDGDWKKLSSLKSSLKEQDEETTKI
jgi:hypothetical protein